MKAWLVQRKAHPKKVSIGWGGAQCHDEGKSRSLPVRLMENRIKPVPGRRVM